MDQLRPIQRVARQIQFTKSQKRLEATDAVNLTWANKIKSQTQYDTIRYINVRSKADEMASLI